MKTSYNRLKEQARVFEQVKLIDEQIEDLTGFAKYVLETNCEVDMLLEAVYSDNIPTFQPVYHTPNEEDRPMYAGYIRLFPTPPKSIPEGVQLVIPNAITLAVIDKTVIRLKRLREELLRS